MNRALLLVAAAAAVYIVLTYGVRK